MFNSICLEVQAQDKVSVQKLLLKNLHFTCEIF